MPRINSARGESTRRVGIDPGCGRYKAVRHILVTQQAQCRMHAVAAESMRCRRLEVGPVTLNPAARNAAVKGVARWRHMHAPHEGIERGPEVRGPRHGI